ncbi:hypothetical protein ACRC7T_07555 [Segnochrobactraceae bacterium EtOH-i3]
MTIDRGDKGGKQKPANDNRPPEGQDAGNEADVSERLDAVVLSIARLIGRQIAREHFDALQAANDNQPPKTGTGVQEDRSGEDDDHLQPRFCISAERSQREYYLDRKSRKRLIFP